MAYSLEPSLSSTVFSPDQLIAGSHDIVTDNVIVAAGQVLTRGALIGQQSTGDFAAVTAAQNTTGGANAGAETISAVTVGSQVKLGTYRVNLTSTTAFNVIDPTGEQVGAAGTVGTAFASAQVGFTVTTGGGIAANDGFNIVVEAVAGSGAGLYVLATGTAVDGSQQPSNWVILAEDTNTSSTGTNAATSAPVYVAGEFDSNYMSWGAGLTAAGIKLGFRQEGVAIYVKTGAVTNAIQ